MKARPFAESELLRCFGSIHPTTESHRAGLACYRKPAVVRRFAFPFTINRDHRPGGGSQDIASTEDDFQTSVCGSTLNASTSPNRLGITMTQLDIEDFPALLDYLRETDRIGPAEQPRLTNLAGGVSNRTVLLERD